MEVLGDNTCIRYLSFTAAQDGSLIRILFAMCNVAGVDGRRLTKTCCRDVSISCALIDHILMDPVNGIQFKFNVESN